MTIFSSSRTGSFLCLSDALHTLPTTYSAVSFALDSSRYLRKQIRKNKQEERHASVFMSRKWNIQMQMSYTAGPFKLCSTSLTDCWFMPSVFGQARFKSTKIRLFDHIRAPTERWLLIIEKVGCESKIPWHILEPPDPPHTHARAHTHTLSGHPESDSELEYTQQNHCLIKWCFSNGVLRNVMSLNFCDETAKSRHVTWYSWP